MAQSQALVDVLKRVLKSHGLTYANVAAGIGMSEANVKRMFATRHFTLMRIDSICQLIGIEITDLLQHYEESRQRISHLTEAQEAELVADMKLLMVAVCVRNHMSFDEIVRYYDIDETECIRHLAHLDRLGLIDLLPKNRIRMRIKEDFRWLPGGPIMQFFKNHVQGDFMQSDFSKATEQRMFLSGHLSKSSRSVLLRKLEDLANEFASLHKQDTGLEFSEKANVGLLIAMRPWELSALKALRRKN